MSSERFRIPAFMPWSAAACCRLDWAQSAMANGLLKGLDLNTLAGGWRSALNQGGSKLPHSKASLNSESGFKMSQLISGGYQGMG